MAKRRNVRKSRNEQRLATGMSAKRGRAALTRYFREHEKEFPRPDQHPSDQHDGVFFDPSWQDVICH